MPSGYFKNFDFRVHHNRYTAEELCKGLYNMKTFFCFQGETGLNTDYKHWQGRFRFKHKTNTLYGVKKLWIEIFKIPILESEYLSQTTNIEFTRRSFVYQMKEETRLTDPYTDINYSNSLNNNPLNLNQEFFDYNFNDPTIYIPEDFTIRYNDLYIWQKEDILMSAYTYNKRSINLIIDTKGNSGKSTISNYIEIGNHGIILPNVNDYDKLIASTCNILMKREIRKPKLLIFDLPRSLTKNKLYGFTSAFETIKNGKVYDLRHQYREWRFVIPQIWVFTNEIIDLTSLSSDRWKIWYIPESNNNLIPIKIDEFNRIIPEIFIDNSSENSSENSSKNSSKKSSEKSSKTI